ncbi:LamG-like jellyroll fold domain-containing protein [Lactiplantibacillus garii]|uniref:LamG-like jellyroll fold domain-containing protein n=1 Tax=Lactiplantibacillus garii TaxID=2306423 RepID=UPI001CDB515F|nr:LamG-like jellyroll fold domain-containing protein [Lactiplantibacillus garii]
MKPRVLTTLLICSSILTTTVTPAIAATTQSNAPTSAKVKKSAKTKAATAESSVADSAFMDLQFRHGQLTDVKGHTAWNKVGEPKSGTDTEVPGNLLTLDGKSAFYTTFSDAQFNELKNGMAIEAYFKYDPAADSNGEHEIFSSQQSGGLGLGVAHGKVIFYAHDGHGYKQPAGTLRAGKWVHAVGVIDKNKTASLYLDGKLVQSVAMPGDLQLAQGTKDFVLGGDARPGGDHVQSQMTGKIKDARLYNHTLTAEQIQSLNREVTAETHETDGTNVVVPAEQTVGTMLVGAKEAAVGHTYGLNVHARQVKYGDQGKLTLDVVFNPDLMYFVDADRTLGGNQTTVKQVANGRLRITSTAKLSPNEFKQYAKTRLAHINLHTKKKAGVAQIRFEQVTKDSTIQLGKALSVKVNGKYALDYNGDGIIGVGDIVKAPDAQKAAVANKAEIKPYKHVVVLTTDGGGNAWSPDGMYYAHGTETPVWTSDPAIMKKRNNPYLMDLFNNKFAMSTSAKAVAPAISAQNYISMLHGRPWETLPTEYQGTNGTMGQEYFADFGKQRQLFPSVFKVLQKNNPTQGAAAFSEWGPIVNSIVEPDAAVKTKQSASLKSFDDVADYIGTSEFDSTSMVYMQSDYMDGQGHGRGWYNDNYWNQYSQYDKLFKKVMDQLEKTGHIHDTLVIANADHGGAHTNHGPNDAPDRDIFIAMGGETVDSGRRLHGGSNSDITALVLDALQVPRAPHMFNSNVFDKSAFLKQTELGKKDRDVEKLHLRRKGQQATIDMSNLRDKRQLRALDMQIDLGNQKVANVKAAKGVKVLRQTVENGTLKLTLSFKKQPTGKLVTVNFKKAAKNAGRVTVQKAMAATTNGTEVLVDLANHDKSKAAKPASQQPAKPAKPAKPTKPAKQKPTKKKGLAHLLHRLGF